MLGFTVIIIINNNNLLISEAKSMDLTSVCLFVCK